MKRLFTILTVLILTLSLFGCAAPDGNAQVAATTLPVYEFTLRLCQGTDISVTRLVAESVSCLHDYSLQVSQMRSIEGADTVILSGAGLEEFLDDALEGAGNVIDASVGIELICPETHDHEHDHDHVHSHSHENDPHIWLSPANAKIMAKNICRGLSEMYPGSAGTFETNLQGLLSDLDTLESYGTTQLAQLKSRELVTFHDGFTYFAQAFDLTILEAVEEESGSEASAAELIRLIGIVQHHRLPAIFTEANGSVSAASVICAEAGCKSYTLDMAMAGNSYFDAMYRNINTIKEALG